MGPYTNSMDESFLSYACDILGNTTYGLSGMKIVEICNAYAVDFKKKIPHSTCPLDAPNKRTALRENLKVFSIEQQFEIINFICDSDMISNEEKVNELKVQLYDRYGEYSNEKFNKSELIIETKHWLSGHPRALSTYEDAFKKYEFGIYERNTLDDMRLSLELLVKDLLDSKRSLENLIRDLMALLKNKGVSTELINMVEKVIKYYTDFQNHHVKHDEKINKDEIEFVIELTSTIMKMLIKICEN